MNRPIPGILFSRGGTSLSKAFNLINRFSEDVDLGINRRFLGFEGDLTRGQVRKLRRACHRYVSEVLPGLLVSGLDALGVEKNAYSLLVENTNISDQDPETIKVYYRPLFDAAPYLSNHISIEVSARSMHDPLQRVVLRSWIDEQYTGAAFTESPFLVQAADPKTTFLEKLLLLHEEFQKPEDKIRHFRMSRHFYDIGQILQSEFGPAALADQALFRSIVAHRRALTPVKAVNYDSLTLQALQLIPPGPHLKYYAADYQEMRSSMIQGKSEDFPVLLHEILARVNP